MLNRRPVLVFICLTNWKLSIRTFQIITYYVVQFDIWGIFKTFP